MRSRRQGWECVGTIGRARQVALATAAILVVLAVRSASGQETAGSRPAPGSDSSSLPLTATRVARFRVSEGTWMSLDVSPSGQTIVFDLLGDLYTLPITGGKARRLTSGVAFNSQPRYSPDGRYLVFVSDRSGTANVWISDRDGANPRQLSHLHGFGHLAVASPAWSPDGRTIIASQMLGAARRGLLGFARTGRWLLAAYDIEAGQMRWISDTTSDSVRSTIGAAFGPEGRNVYAAIDASPNPDDWWSEVQWRIARVDLTTGSTRPEIGSRLGRVGMRPAASRNGRYLAYVSNSGARLGIRLRDLKTDRERWLVRESLDNPSPSPQLDSRDLLPGYAFTPDSRSLIVAYAGKIHRIDVASGRTRVIPFIADVARGLGPLTTPQFGLSDTTVRTLSVMGPALSPDGQWAAFSALDRIWIMQLPSKGRAIGPPRRLTRDSVGEFYPSWSPDGLWIAYTTWEDGVGGAVRRANVTVDTNAMPSQSTRLTTDNALYFNTAVAPDGERVVAVRGVPPPEVLLTPRWQGSLEPVLVSLPARGGHIRTITSLTGDQHPWRNPQRGYPVDQVYFTTDHERVYVGLTSWRWDGSDRRTAVAVTGVQDSYEPYAVAGVLSPDSRRGFIMRRFTLFEFALPFRTIGLDTLELDRARTKPFGTPSGAAQRWGTVLSLWVSWSLDGRRVLFGQGGTLFLGDVQGNGWTSFRRIEVPLTIPVDVPRGTLVLRGARLITMRGKEVIPRGDLVVRNNRILAVGVRGRVAIPKGAEVVDVSGTTILPGYVDIHDHVRLPRGVHAQQCWECLTRLAYGVTTSRDPQSFNVDVFTYRERERAGAVLGPRLFSTGPGYFGVDPPILTLADASELVRTYRENFGSETFKNYDYGPASSRAAWELIAMAASRQGLIPTAHGQGLETQLTMILDGFSGIEHTPGIPIYDDVATLIARSGTTHTETYGRVIFGSWHYMLRRHGPIWEAPKMRQFAPPSARGAGCDWCIPYSAGPPEIEYLLPLLRGAAQTVAKGGRVGMGSHGDIPGLGVHYELWFYALGGMPNYEILRSATIVGAAAIGHAPDFGSLEPGKLADLQILDKNPLVNIHNTTSIRYIMKNGRLYLADDLTEIWPRHKPLPSIYLWERKDSLDSTTAPERAAP